jgi:putative sterol carrier protein
MDRARTKLTENPAIAEQIGATYKFELSGDGGGTWLATLKDQPKIEETDGAADCTLKLAASDYVDLMEGRVEAPQLFFAGKLQIDGDLGLAMKLGSLTALLV